MRAFIIEDDHYTVMLLSELLQELGFESYTCDNAVDALTVLEHEKEIDLVLLDILLPGPSGLSVLEVLVEQYSRLPVLVVSAHVDSAKERPAILDRTPILMKPFTRAEFRRAVSNLNLAFN